jgi:hypothetical protein
MRPAAITALRRNLCPLTLHHTLVWPHPSHPYNAELLTLQLLDYPWLIYTCIRNGCALLTALTRLTLRRGVPKLVISACVAPGRQHTLCARMVNPASNYQCMLRC